MPNHITKLPSLTAFFLKLILLIVSVQICAGFMMGCGSSTTIVFQNADDSGGGGDDEDGSDEVTAKAPNSTGAPVIQSQTEHIELLMSGGDAIPMTLSRTQSGSVEISSDLNF
jgi:hypothetical protein